MNYVKLTVHSMLNILDGNTIYIRPDSIDFIRQDADCTLLQVNGEVQSVKESTSEVLDAITRAEKSCTAIY